MSWREFRSHILPWHYVVVLYCLLVITLLVIRNTAVEVWWAYALVHTAVILSAVIVIRTCGGAKKGLRAIVRDWDALVYILVLFMMTTKIVHPVNPHDVDRLLITWDQAIGGIALLQWTQTWATPFLDEVAKVAWVMYFPIAIPPGIVLYLRNRAAFEELKVILVMAWLVSYAIYFAMPAEGPLHYKEELGLENPSGGVIVAATLKTVVSEMEGSEARDAFPSGHCMIAALVLFACLRNRLWKTSIFVVPICLGIILSTIYLRYHYVIDVIVGLALCVPIAWASIVWCRKASGPASGADAPEA